MKRSRLRRDHTGVRTELRRVFRHRVPVQGARRGAASKLSEAERELLLLLDREVLCAEEDDTAVGDERREVADELVAVLGGEEGGELRVWRGEFGPNVWCEVQVRELLERAEEGKRDSDGHCRWSRAGLGLDTGGTTSKGLLFIDAELTCNWS